MTTIKLYTINCDATLNGGTHAPGCANWIGNCDTAAEARAEAKRFGWQSERLGGYRNDFSPQCWAQHHMIRPAPADQGEKP